MQTLEVEITGDFNSVLQSVRESTGANLEPRPDGFHLTIIGPTESKILSTLDDATLAELQQINEQIQRGEGIVVKGVGFIDGSSPQYQMREVEDGDIHMQVLRQEPVKPGSSKIKDVTGPIPKQADPRFSEVALPEMNFGGLDGQMKQRK